ncbi:MAG: hypothetical protein JW901_05550 [Dehalococcoidia bacterium]|nr:hypothetical protein [Dehalococcoidia bacterium]
MPIELNFEDITPSAGKPQQSSPFSPVPVDSGAPGGGILSWIDQINNILDKVNQMLVNYKEIKSNMQPEQRQQPSQLQSFPHMSYIEPPTGHPAAPQPAAMPSFDINAALLDKAREIIRTLYNMGFQEATVENVFDSFKDIKISQLAGMLGVKDDTRSQQ